MLTRKDYVKWCKGRAIKLAETGDLKNAVASMISDLGKDNRTKDLGELMPMLFMIVMPDIVSGNKEAVIKWINDFAEY